MQLLDIFFIKKQLKYCHLNITSMRAF